MVMDIHRRRQAQIAYGRVDTALKVMCSMATTATFVRVASEHGLPPVFLNLPMLLLLLVILEKSGVFPMDDMTLSMLKGATTGVISGFLSSIVTNSFKYSHEEKKVSLKMRLLNNFELLHIPVVIGTLFFSFCVTFERLPPSHRVKVSAMTGICGAIMLTVFLNFLDGDAYGQNTRSLYDYGKIFLFAYIVIFFMSLTQIAQTSQKPWLVCVIVIFLVLNWQFRHFDDLVWDWAIPKMPVPGFLIGIIVLNLQDLTSGHLALPSNKPDVEENDQKTPRFSNEEILWNAYVWHTVTFIVERISLAVISLRQHKKSNIPPNDSIMCCIFLLGFLLIISPLKDGSLRVEGSVLQKTIMVMLGLALYVSVGLTGGLLNNGYFIDTIFGLTILYITQKHKERPSSSGYVST